MHGIDEHDALCFEEVAAGEDAAVDGADAGGNQDPGSFLAGEREGFGESISCHAGGVWGGGIVGPSVSWSVPVAVAVDQALFVDVIDEGLQGVLDWAFAAFEEHSGRFLSVAVGGAVQGTDTGEVDLVLLTVDEVLLSRGGEGGIAGADDQSCSEEDGNYRKHNHEDRVDKHSDPFPEGPPGFLSSGKAFLFLPLAPSNGPVLKDVENGYQGGPDDRGDTNPALFDAQLRYTEDNAHIHEEEDGQHYAGYGHGL